MSLACSESRLKNEVVTKRSAPINKPNKPKIAIPIFEIVRLIADELLQKHCLFIF